MPVFAINSRGGVGRGGLPSLFSGGYRIVFSAVLCAVMFAYPAHAQTCSGPDGVEGDIIYNTSYNVPQYCNGTNWIAFGALNPSAGGSGCSDPDGIAGDLVYNSTHHVLQYCDGDDWHGVGSFATGGLIGPSGCANIGDQCADTTIFAGWHPVTHEKLFIPPTDQGTTSVWKTSTGTNDIATDSLLDGLSNTNQVPNNATFPAFKLCKDLTLAGKTWYLPARAELDYLYNNRAKYVAKAPGNGFTNFQNAYYWSSTEYNTVDSWGLHFADGYFLTYGKTYSYRVRCVGR